MTIQFNASQEVAAICSACYDEFASKEYTLVCIRLCEMIAENIRSDRASASAYPQQVEILEKSAAGFKLVEAEHNRMGFMTDENSHERGYHLFNLRRVIEERYTSNDVRAPLAFLLASL